MLLNPGKYCKPDGAPRPGDAPGPQGPLQAGASDPSRGLASQQTVDGDQAQEQVFEINDNEPL